MGASLDHLLAYVEGIRYRGSGRRHFALVPVSGDAWEPKADQLSGSYNIEVLAYRAGQPARALAFMRALARHLETRAGKSEMVEPELQQAQLAQLRLVNIGPFQDLTLDLDETWSILLGDNGVGKSTILKAIALAICGEDARQFAGRLLTFGRGSGQIELVTARGERYITNLKSTTVETEVTCLPQRPLEIEGWLALGFPPLRGMSWQQPGGPQLGQETRQGPNPADLLPLMTGAADPRIVELKQWVVNLDYRALKEGDPKSQRLFDDFGQVIDRLTVGMKLEDIQVAPKTFEITVKVDGVRVPVEMLSQGTQSLIGWVGVLLERLYEFYDEVDKPREEYALVLMDEIDAHMHPEWQQTLIPSLKALFPNAQFIVTTHSPLIPISSAPEEVYRLRRDERTQGQVAVEKLEIDLRRWRADQVLTSSLFDLDSTMAPEVYKALSRYTELSAQDELTEEDLAELERHAAMLQVRLPTPMERREARQAYERIEECLDAQLAAISAKERKKLLDEVKVQLQENITGSRRPQ
jgi:hypothetical protein